MYNAVKLTQIAPFNALTIMFKIAILLFLGVIN